MFLSPFQLVLAVLFALGVFWCKQMLPQWREHLREFRDNKDWADRLALLVLWSMTALILFFCIGFVWAVGGRILGGIQDLR
ncbi:MAG: hypothetical protein HY735_05205 [Verrucomicrobia bacterium]|nr:hypothetical protein [Verrucomicrobiota bacterium]